MKTILYLASVAVVFCLSVQSACAQTPPASPPVKPVANQPWTSSLGVKFVPAGTDGVLFSVWDVRVKDFKAFVDATGYDATKGMSSLDTDGWKARGDTWKSPGFAQTDDDPVVGMNYYDAKAFCAWLTKKEQAEGKLAANQLYRLPYDAEWSKAVGLNESEGSPKSKAWSSGTDYPWGKGWPPPKGAGNYAGSEANDAKWFSKYPTIKGYDDGYPRTSPVGSFPPNAYGLYDMGGNVWQWCDDNYDDVGRFYHECMVQRGCSWGNYNFDYLPLRNRNYILPGSRASRFGFRVVVVVSP